MSTIVDGATAVVRGIVGEAAARDGHLVGVGDGAALSEAAFSHSRVALEGAVGDVDLAVGAVPHSAAVTGLVAFEGGAGDGDGAEGAEITRSVVDGTAGLGARVVAREGALLDGDLTIAVIDGTGNVIDTGVAGEGHAIDRQRSTVGVVDGAGNIGLVAFKAAAGDGQRAFVPEGTSLMARELGVGDGRFAIFVNGKLVDRAAAGHAACKGRNAVFIDFDHVVSCGITLFKRDGAFNGTLFDGHTASVGNGALTVDIFDSDRDALIDIHDTAIEREFVEGSAFLTV